MEIDEMTAEQLEAALDKKRKSEQARAEKERKNYEKQRDKSLEFILETAKWLNGEIKQFKNQCHEIMDIQQEKLDGYGMIRSNSKGGFSITNSEGLFRVVRRRDTEPNWDERASKAIVLIKDFLQDTVKKRDAKLFEILLGFLEKNGKGDLEYPKVFSLMKHRNKFDDERWLKGLRLLEESFSNHLKGYGYEFKTRDETNDGKWESINLNFSSL